MEAMRRSWTDERLDDFRGEVNRRFDEVDRRFDKVEGDMAVLRADIKSDFDLLHTRFDSLQRSLLQASVVLIVALLGMLGTQL